MDLLFYHVQLHCYIVLELKTGKFKPSYLGQLEFYLTVVDSDIKHLDDAPSIGLLLCRDANRVVVEYALKTKNQPMGVAKYILSENKLPSKLKDILPTQEQLEHILRES